MSQSLNGGEANPLDTFADAFQEAPLALYSSAYPSKLPAYTEAEVEECLESLTDRQE